MQYIYIIHLLHISAVNELNFEVSNLFEQNY